MFVFEGKCRLITPGQTVRFMFHVDHKAGQLRIQIDEREPDTHSFAAWAELFKGLFPFPAPRGLLSMLAEAPQEPEPGNIALLANLAGIGSGLQGKLDLRTDAWGVSSILQSKSCEKADFSPQGKTVIDLRDTDFSGVRFVDTDFSQAILSGVNFSRCSFENCTFARTQLSLLRLIGADLTRQPLRNLDLSGAKGLIPPTDPDHFTDWLKGVIAYRRSRSEEQTSADIDAGLAECMRHGTTLIGDIASEGKSWDALSRAKTRAVVFWELSAARALSTFLESVPTILAAPCTAARPSPRRACASDTSWNACWRPVLVVKLP